MFIYVYILWSLILFLWVFKCVYLSFLVFFKPFLFLFILSCSNFILINYYYYYYYYYFGCLFVLKWERETVDLGEGGSGKVVGGAGRVETVIIICGI